MKRERMEYREPYGRGDYELHRGGEGVYWHAGNGLSVRMAAAEHPAGESREWKARESLPGEVVSWEGWPTGLAR
jgi:hypothetical protein